MLLSITSTTPPARDLGYLLRKHPDRVQTFELNVGEAHVFYPEATDARCTATMLLDIDPIALVRGRARSTDGGLFEAYVNDRPYAVSSFMSVAIARIYGTALAGRSDRAELLERELALTATVEPIRGASAELSQTLFAPLGYVVASEPVGAAASGYRRLTLAGTTTLQRLLTHLYVLLPVMDNDKHYWVGDDEIEKLFRFGGAWLDAHPARETIARRYLKRAPALVREALARFGDRDAPEDAAGEPVAGVGEAVLERPMRLQDRRIAYVLETLRNAHATSVVDVGCGDGDLLAELAREPQITRMLGVDVAMRELERAKERLARIPLPASRRETIALVQSSVVYDDARTHGFDAAALLEVIEHVDRERLETVERIVFGEARPRVVVLTTPNREYNARFETLPAGAFRHPDHRFEFTRAEFVAWANDVGARFGYDVRFDSIGDADAAVGPPTQAAVFTCA
jgi:3' terminal RNA ribose 2'-O-methyltransferase Hen1